MLFHPLFIVGWLLDFPLPSGLMLHELAMFVELVVAAGVASRLRPEFERWFGADTVLSVAPPELQPTHDGFELRVEPPSQTAGLVGSVLFGTLVAMPGFVFIAPQSSVLSVLVTAVLHADQELSARIGLVVLATWFQLAMMVIVGLARRRAHRRQRSLVRLVGHRLVVDDVAMLLDGAQRLTRDHDRLEIRSGDQSLVIEGEPATAAWLEQQLSQLALPGGREDIPDGLRELSAGRASASAEQ